MIKSPETQTVRSLTPIDAINHTDFAFNEVIDIVVDLYDSQGELRFLELEHLLEISESETVANASKIQDSQDSLAGLKFQSALHDKIMEQIGDVAFFQYQAALDLIFRIEDVIAFYQALKSGSVDFEYWQQCSLFFLCNPWLKLQLVLASQIYSADKDIHGLTLGHAWKAGNGQSILTANFDFQSCSQWLQRAGVRGLNVVGPAPKTPLKKTLYRGGAFSDRLHHGMAWTECKETAKFFATRLSKNTPIIVSTASNKDEVIVRYEHEMEVVLPYDTNREFNVEFIETN